MNWKAPYSPHIPLKHWEHARYKQGYGSLFTSGTECIICLPREEMDEHQMKTSSLLVNVQRYDMTESINADFYSARADRIESAKWFRMHRLGILVCWFECGVRAIWSRNDCTHPKQIAYKDNQRRSLDNRSSEIASPWTQRISIAKALGKKK